LGERRGMTESCPLPSGRECIASAEEWKGFVDELREQWKLMWRERVDDKVRAEGIASDDFEMLFVDRGTVIIATRCYKQLDFKEILEKYGTPYDVKVKLERPLPRVGGWRKFGRGIAASCRNVKKRRRRMWPKEENGNEKTHNLQLKKGGRGWLHIKTE